MSEAAAAAAAATPAAPPPSMLDQIATQDPPRDIPPAPSGQTQPTALPAWRNGLPEDIRADEGLSKFDAIKDDAERNAMLARSYVNAQKMIGGDKLPKPKGPDDKEALDAVYTALGRPEAADKYVITRPKAEELPPGLNVDDEGEKFLKDFAFANGWNQRQLDNAYKAFYEREATRIKAGISQSQSSYEDAMRDFQREGNATETLTLAKAGYNHAATPEVTAKLKAAGLDNDPQIIRMFARIGKDLAGHQILKGSGGETIKTAEMLKSDIAKFRTDNHDALYSRAHPNNRAAQAQLDAMYKQLYGEKSA